MLVECLPSAAVELSNFNFIPENAKTQDLKTKIEEQQKLDNHFFGIQSIFDKQQSQIGTVLKQSRSLTNKKQNKGKKNEFYPYAENFIYQMMHLMSQTSILSQPVLAGRILYSLSVVLDAAQNHWRIVSIT